MYLVHQTKKIDFTHMLILLLRPNINLQAIEGRRTNDFDELARALQKVSPIHDYAHGCAQQWEVPAERGEFPGLRKLANLHPRVGRPNFEGPFSVVVSTLTLQLICKHFRELCFQISRHKQFTVYREENEIHLLKFESCSSLFARFS